MKVIESLKWINQQSNIKNVIIEDTNFIMSSELFNRSMENGYGKFSDIAKHMQLILLTAQEMRDDLNVFFMFHQDVEMVDGYLPDKKIKTVGKMVRDKWEPEAVFRVILYTKTFFDKDKHPQYKFVTI